MKISVNSRIGKKQVIAFLDNAQISAAYNYAIQKGLTNQEVISESINTVLVENGEDPFLPVSHERLKRRHRGRAKLRTEDTKSRVGKRSFGGWFLKEDVDNLVLASQQMNLTIQEMIERGIFNLTGVAVQTCDDDDFYSDGVVWE